MVRVEPFVYQMVTAFKERIQMVSKINEIIDIVNQDVGSDEVRAIVTEMLSDYYDKETIDEMFDSIDFSPYYTKTEVNAIVDRIDGDVDAVEDRVDMAEDDIDALETGKQDVLTAVEPVTIYDEDNIHKIGIRDLTEVQLTDVAVLNSSTVEFLYDVYVARRKSSLVLIKKGTELSLYSDYISIPDSDGDYLRETTIVFQPGTGSVLDFVVRGAIFQVGSGTSFPKGIAEVEWGRETINKNQIHFYRRI